MALWELGYTDEGEQEQEEEGRRTNFNGSRLD